MKFLRDSALQGAAFFIAVVAIILQFPQHLTWLFPLCILFVTLLYMGHRYSPVDKNGDNEARIGSESIVSLYNSIRPQIRDWGTPFLTVLMVLTSTIFTIRGIYQTVLADKLPPTPLPTPIPIGPGISVNGTLAIGEIDNYSFTSLDNTIVTIIVEDYGDLWTSVEVFYSNEERIIHELKRNKKSFPFAPEAGTEYIIRVRGLGSSGTGSYTIRMSYGSQGEQ